MKYVAVLVVSVVVIGLILRYCILPPHKMPDFVLGDAKCDMCGERAVYQLWVADRYLGGEYCDAHRWIGVIHSDPMRKMSKVLLGASMFGVIYSAVSLLAGSKRQKADSDLVSDSRAGGE